MDISVMQVLMFLATILAPLVYGHGRLIDPPARASMWRLGFNTPTHYTDQELFCGGYRRQWTINGGRCGECGDPWDLPRPRPNEGGGTWGTGTLSRVYHQGDILVATIHLTANHMGWFEFRLCPNNNPRQYVKQSCLNKNILKLVDYPGTRFHIKHSGTGLFRIRLQLPKKLTCSQCVLQWHYTTGNNWGFCPDGSNQPGCGPQEVFRGCSDIAVYAQDDQTYYKYSNLTMEADFAQYLNLNPENDRQKLQRPTNRQPLQRPTSIPISNDLDTNAVIDSSISKKPSITFVDDVTLFRQSISRKKSAIDQAKITDPDYFSGKQKLGKSKSKKYVSSDLFRKTQPTVDNGMPLSAPSPFLTPGHSLRTGPIVYNPYALGITPSPLGPPLLFPADTKPDQLKPRLLHSRTIPTAFEQMQVPPPSSTKVPEISVVSELSSDKLKLEVPFISGATPVVPVLPFERPTPSHFTIQVPMSALNDQESLKQLMQLRNSLDLHSPQVPMSAFSDQASLTQLMQLRHSLGLHSQPDTESHSNITNKSNDNIPMFLIFV